MPIRLEERARYPKDWPAISAAARERARHECEWCGVRNYAIGGRDHDGAFLPAQPLGENIGGLEWPKPGEDGWCSAPGREAKRLRLVRIVLTVAHLDHVPENCAPENLKALCQRCHLRYDAEHHRKNSHATRRKAKAVGDLLELAAAPPLSATLAELRAVPTDMPHDEMHADLMREREDDDASKCPAPEEG